MPLRPWKKLFEAVISKNPWWTYKRDARISLSVEEILWAREGIPYLRPEVQLLHKAPGLRPKDQADFDACLHLLEFGRAGIGSDGRWASPIRATHGSPTFSRSHQRQSRVPHAAWLVRSRPAPGRGRIIDAADPLGNDDGDDDGSDDGQPLHGSLSARTGRDELCGSPARGVVAMTHADRDDGEHGQPGESVRAP